MYLMLIEFETALCAHGKFANTIHTLHIAGVIHMHLYRRARSNPFILLFFASKLSYLSYEIDVVSSIDTWRTQYN